MRNGNMEIDEKRWFEAGVWLAALIVGMLLVIVIISALE